MELSNKQKTFYELLSEFLNRRLNFEHCQKKKDDPHSSWFFGTKGSDRNTVEI